MKQESCMSGGNGSVDGEIENVKVTRIAGGALSIFGRETLGKHKRHHFFVTSPMRAQAAFKRLEIVVFRSAAEHDISGAHDNEIAKAVERKFQLCGGDLSFPDLGYSVEGEKEVGNFLRRFARGKMNHRE